MSEEESSDPPRIEGRRICITGGAGFIGSSLALRLAEHNEIVLFDNLHRNALPWTDLLDRERVTFLQGDVLPRRLEGVQQRPFTLCQIQTRGTDTANDIEDLLEQPKLVRRKWVVLGEIVSIRIRTECHAAVSECELVAKDVTLLGEDALQFVFNLLVLF